LRAGLPTTARVKAEVSPMDSSVEPGHRAARVRQRLVTRPLVLRLVTVVGSSASFFLLLPDPASLQAILRAVRVA